MRSAMTFKGLLFIAAFGFCLAPLNVNAQGYPSRSITVVVPFPAGGPSDVVARIVTDHTAGRLATR
jgi:tripartite-type tricarboxylate transporter receptor subunit TctC